MAISYGPEFGKVRVGGWGALEQEAEIIHFPALGHSKGNSDDVFGSSTYPLRPLADIVKMVESEPELAARIRRVRGGYLKIQGTWMPYEVGLGRYPRMTVGYSLQTGCSQTLSQVHPTFVLVYPAQTKKSQGLRGTFAMTLFPCSGTFMAFHCFQLCLKACRYRPTFPNTCIAPDQPGFGQIISGDTRRRRNRRMAGPTNGSNHFWSVMSPADQTLPSQDHLPPLHQQFHVGNPQDTTHLSSTSRELPLPRSPNPPAPASHPGSPHYSPYQSSYLNHRPEIQASDQPFPRRPASTSPVVREAHRVSLPPVQPSSSNHAVSLPSVADLVGFNAIGDRDPPTAILERLKREDSSAHRPPTPLATLL